MHRVSHMHGMCCIHIDIVAHAHVHRYLFMSCNAYCERVRFVAYAGVALCLCVAQMQSSMFVHMHYAYIETMLQAHRFVSGRVRSYRVIFCCVCVCQPYLTLSIPHVDTSHWTTTYAHTYIRKGCIRTTTRPCLRTTTFACAKFQRNFIRLCNSCAM